MKLSDHRWTATAIAAAMAIAAFACTNTLAKSPTFSTTSAERLALAKLDAGQPLAPADMVEVVRLTAKLVDVLGQRCKPVTAAACISPKPPVVPELAGPDFAAGLKVVERAVQPQN